MLQQFQTFLLLTVCIYRGSADIYLHNPRGSNNRYNENSRNRNNANRLFNSENNNRGGYNVGKVYYYAGSTLQVEWTNQHSCGDQNSNCNIVLQYMCGSLVRDGLSSSTIPGNPVLCKNLDCNEDRWFGMHEDFFYQAHCRLRSRNMGLFTANQRVGPAARHTRQNSRGNRYGYECQEEKDYYPYWGPTPWKDIAILTNNISKCEMYQAESQNVKAKYACKVGDTYLYQNIITDPQSYIPITEEECEQFTYTENGVTRNGTWTLYNSHNIDPPECVATQPSRDNHLGNTLGGQTLNYNWTIPDEANENCVLRIRYNISTNDYDGETTTSANNRGGGKPGVKIWEKYGFSQQEGRSRGYIFTNNPTVNVFNNNKLNLRLSLNTNQYGRTFQDRSHTFAIRPRPADIPQTATIQNINVRGKRGNIVQVYPAVEYDFVPNTVLAKVESYIHFQWTGSNSNPGNNDGQGRAGSDRNNVVVISEPSYIEGNPYKFKNNTYGQLGSNYPAFIADGFLGGLSEDDLLNLAILTQQLGGDMDELDDAGTYFDLGPRKVTRSGTYNYMCTRNNNFSNRSQKGRLIVTSSTFKQKHIDQKGGKVVVRDDQRRLLTSLTVPPEALSARHFIELRELSPEDASSLPSPVNSNFISRVIFLGPVEDLTGSRDSLVLEIRLLQSPSALYDIAVYRTNLDATAWHKVKIENMSSDMVTVRTYRGGYFVATKQAAAGPWAGLIIGLFIGIVLIVAIAIYCRKNKLSLTGFSKKI